MLKVAHIFCDSNKDTDCKKQWQKHRVLQTVTVASEFKPDEYKTGGDKIFGLFTATGDRYAITCNIYNPEIANPHRKDMDWWVDKYSKDARIPKNDIQQLAKNAAKIKKFQLNAIYPGLSFIITDIFHNVPAGHFPEPESPQQKFQRIWKSYETGSAFRQ